MLIQLSRILSQDGKREQFEIPIEMDRFSCRVGDFAIVRKDPMQLTIANTGRRVLRIEGEAKLVISIPCARCLEPVNTEFDISIDREVDMKLSEEERLEELDECGYISGTELDAEQLLYNEILINWPIRVLCKDDCKGICSRCGANLNFQTCDCDTTVPDPRMAAIRDIFSKFKEV